MNEKEKLWGSWTVDQFIGEGSFGKVYKIVREDFGHTYSAALKVLSVPQNQSEYKTVKSEGLSDESAKAYFKSMVEDIVSEFALMSQLKGNTNIVSYEDHMINEKEDEFGWEIFIRMELLTPLFDYLESHELKVRDVIKLGIDICRALEVCQKYNIIHRDIKPENIFVSDTGAFKLGDFGIARQLEKTSGMSKKGTYTYMAPEVYKGQEYNSTVDIYSLGIVLYRFLNNNRSPFMPPITEQIKFSDKEQANIKRLSGEKMPKPVNASGRLSEIVLKACAYNPKDRYTSPLTMRKELEALLYSESEQKIAYPNGDVLKNDKNDYVTSSKGKIEEFKDSDATFVLDRTADQFKEMEERTGELDSAVDSKDDKSVKTETKPEVSKKEVVDKSAKEEDKAVVSKDKNTNNKKESKKSKKKLVIALFIILAIGAGIFINNTLKNRDYSVVPNVVGTNVDKAIRQLEKEGFKVETTEAEKKGTPKDTVISQKEKVGQIMKKDKTIHLVVCNGLVTVPNFVSLTEDQAKKRAESEHVKVKSVYAFEDSIAKGKVIKQSAIANNKIGEGAEITITVSKGKEKIKIPNLKKQVLEKAKAKLKKLGFKITVDTKYSSSVKANRVIKTSPKAGKKLVKGKKVKIVASLGKKPKPTSAPVDNSSDDDSYSSNNNSNRSNSSNYSNPKPAKKKPKKKSSGSDLNGWERVN